MIRSLLVMVAVASSGTAVADEPTASPRSGRLALFVAPSYLSSPGANGGAFTVGLRSGFARYAAVNFDLGYGLVAAGPTVQDRWWLMPSLALVLPGDPVRFELGVGIGLGAASGYTAWPAYVAGPFNPIWAFQLVPAARVHAVGSVDLTRTVDLFVRLDAARLLLDGNEVGFRAGDPRRSTTDTTWVNLAIGVQLRLR